MKALPRKWAGLLVLVVLTGCADDGTEYRTRVSDPELLHSTVKKLTDITVHDIFSPPHASRAYVYSSIAAYEALVPSFPQYRTLAGQLNELLPIPEPDSETEIIPEIASLHAFAAVAREMVFSQSEIDAFVADLDQNLRSLGIPRQIFQSSVDYGSQVARHILAWAGTDNYKETRSSSKYEVTDDPARWVPTPPAYLDAIEPSWNELRPFVMHSTDQFKPSPPTPYDSRENSVFYEEAYDVYETHQNLDEERTEIAAFWDCNPYVMHTSGHVMFATKKVTPGGHWMGIATIASRLDGADFAKSALIYAKTSIALADGFISSWDEKYRSDLVRPETYINRFIDEDWVPVLQTPPFPEHTSAHSVISTAAALVLTDIFGPDFEFDDTTELEFGLPMRSFSSFIEASEEAAISRLYGGIHYRPAIVEGIVQGRGVGRLVLERANMDGERLAEVVELE